MDTFETGRLERWHLDMGKDRTGLTDPRRVGLWARLCGWTVRAACGLYLAFLAVGLVWFGIID